MAVNVLSNRTILRGLRQLSPYSNWLRAGRSGDRIPVWGELFRPRPERPGARPAFYIKGTGSFPGSKVAGG